VYDLEPCEPIPGIETTGVTWGEALAGSARELLASAEAQTDPEERTALDEAKDFIVSELSAGPVSSREVLSGARELGIAEKTLRRAQKELKVTAEKSDFKKGWRWRLPDDGQDGQDGQKVATPKPWPSSEDLAIFDDQGKAAGPEDGQKTRRWPSNRDGHLLATLGTFDDSATDCDPDDWGEDII
jgi:hypothetical protein